MTRFYCIVYFCNDKGRFVVFFKHAGHTASNPQKRKKRVQTELQSFRWFAPQGSPRAWKLTHHAGKELAMRNTKMHTFKMISFITQIVTEELHKAAPRSEKGSRGRQRAQCEQEPEA